MVLVDCLPNKPNVCYFADKSDYGYESKLFDLEKQIEIGSFEISGKFDSGKTVDMGISVDEDYRRKGYSKGLVRALCKYIIQVGYPKIRKDQILFIDTDASVGFWDKIGMTPHRYGDDYMGHRDIEGVGYEKMITFGELCKWSGVSLPTGGVKKRKNAKTVKKRKNTKTVKKRKNAKTLKKT